MKTLSMRKIMTLRRTQSIQTSPLITNQVVSNVSILAKMTLGEGARTDKSLSDRELIAVRRRTAKKTMKHMSSKMAEESLRITDKSSQG